MIYKIRWTDEAIINLNHQLEYLEENWPVKVLDKFK